MEELLKENQKLKARIEYLETILNRKNSSGASAYNEIRGMIINKVNDNIKFPDNWESWMEKSERQRAERLIMSDLKWDLRVRNITDFRNEHIESARRYIDEYKLNDKFQLKSWR